MKWLLSAAVLLTLTVTTAGSQEPNFPSPQKEHEWLKQFAGDWTSLSKTVPMEGVPAMECPGTMKSRMLGGFWIVNDMHGDMGGQTFNAVQTIGYEPAKAKYVGSWVDSMTNHLWHYEGTVDESGKKLVLEAEGPSYITTGETAKYRDSYEFESPDRILTTSEIMGKDGKWITFMTGEMKRAKP
ncbi:MAG: DUF1579 domain-containing protein [Planctomycetaceae bacterium]|nr:DUF1579 domain-containing protein [Planctomycetaceae bacterium]